MKKTTTFSIKAVLLLSVLICSSIAVNAQALGSTTKSSEVSTDTETAVAYWNFNEGSGTSIADAVGSATGTLTNPSSSPWATGLLGNALDFSASGLSSSYVNVPSTSDITFSTGSFSIGAVVKLTELNSSFQIIAYKGNLSDAVDGHWYSLFVNSSSLYMYVDDKTVVSNVSFSITDLTLNVWNYFVCVRDTANASLYLYVNGVKVATASDGTGDLTSTLPLMIGNMASLNGQFTGFIDELKIYNRALSATEIASMNTTYGCPTAGGSSSIEEASATSALSVYPNPAVSELNISCDNLKTVEVYSLLGQKMLVGSSNSMNVSSLASGTYIIRVTTDDNTVQTTKFIKE